MTWLDAFLDLLDHPAIQIAYAAVAAAVTVALLVWLA